MSIHQITCSVSSKLVPVQVVSSGVEKAMMSCAQGILIVNFGKPQSFVKCLQVYSVMFFSFENSSQNLRCFQYV